MRLIDNINSLLGEDLKGTLKAGLKLKIAASCFSIYAYVALKKELKNKLAQKAIARECADWIRRKAIFGSLDFDFFELLDSVTIARSRRHIETFYNTAEIGSFPDRRKPQSFHCPLTHRADVIGFNGIFCGYRDRLRRGYLDFPVSVRIADQMSAKVVTPLGQWRSSCYDVSTRIY